MWNVTIRYIYIGESLSTNQYSDKNPRHGFIIKAV